jgi:peptidoglycan/LPS O-acetylase OafA/YrhL
MTRPGETDRLKYIDGLRFLAVLAVVCFHYFSRWTPPFNDASLYPYGSHFANFPFFAFGNFGVHLFFIISGFVIALTLARCSSLKEFAARRYSRLAPAMLLCATATFIVNRLLPSSPFSAPLIAFVPSLTFLDPKDLNRLFASEAFVSMDGAYWSLYVEAKFYVLAAVTYFACRSRFLSAVCLIATIAVLLHLATVPILTTLADRLLIPTYLPWFILGIGFHNQHVRGRRKESAFAWTCGVALLLVLAWSDKDPALALAAFVLPLLFWATGHWALLKSIASSGVCAGVGAASYSLYLLHQHIGVGLLHYFAEHTAVTGAISAALALLLMLVMCLSATMSYRLIELRLTKLVLQRLQR